MILVFQLGPMRGRLVRLKPLQRPKKRRARQFRVVFLLSLFYRLTPASKAD